MDDRTKRAEELMEDRLRKRDGDVAAPGDETAGKLDQLTRDLQRERADFANYRRRNEAERADFARFAKTELITRLLDVLDDFDRALDHVPADMRDQPWVEGIWLARRKLRDILTAEGLEEVGSVGKPFDPYVHEAIGHVDSDAPEGTVVDEIRKAYKLHDRVIRPAVVTVARGVVPPGAQTEAPVPRGAQTEAPVPPGAQTEEPQRRGRAPGPERGVPPSDGRNGDEVEHLGRASGSPASEVGKEEE